MVLALQSPYFLLQLAKVKRFGKITVGTIPDEAYYACPGVTSNLAGVLDLLNLDQVSIEAHLVTRGLRAAP